MPFTIPASYVTEKNKLLQPDPWIWLIEMWAVDTVALRITPYLKNVTWPASGGDVYYAYPCFPPSWVASTEGETPIANLTVANPDGQFTTLLDTYGGMRDRRVVIRLAHESQLAEDPIPFTAFDVAKTNAAREVIQFTLGPLHVSEAEFPRHTFSRAGNCRWRFGSNECGYDTGRPGAKFATCGKTFEDCTERGDDEVAAGLPRNHPKRFGAFPSIPLVRQ